MPADRGSNSATPVAYGASASEREKSLELTVSQIERRFGKGAIMKLGEHRAHVKIESIPTGSIMLDLALRYIEAQDRVAGPRIAPQGHPQRP